MQLVINTPGSYLRKKEGNFLVKTDEQVFEVSAKKVQTIMITTSAFLSTDAIKLAMDNNIDVIFLDEFGDPFGRVWHSKLGSTTLIRRKQLEIANDERGLNLAKEWMVTKMDHQIDFLKRLKNSRPQKEEELESYLLTLEEIRQKMYSLGGTIEEKRGNLMGFEGSAGKTYFDALSFIMPDRFKFNGRSRMPAKDEFNCLLNYGQDLMSAYMQMRLRLN
jgi:CRISPR-associated protein Cas1